MEITHHCDDLSFSWKQEPLISHWLDEVARSEGCLISSLSFVYCSDERLLEMNKQHLDHDYYTDIITFDLSDGGDIEGEIYISLDRVRENAEIFEDGFENELCRVMVHGLLHLIGYNDQTEDQKKEMRSKETIYLSLLPEVPRGTFK